jgi:hypothetical protein
MSGYQRLGICLFVMLLYAFNVYLCWNFMPFIGAAIFTFADVAGFVALAGAVAWVAEGFEK